MEYYEYIKNIKSIDVFKIFNKELITISYFINNLPNYINEINIIKKFTSNITSIKEIHKKDEEYNIKKISRSKLYIIFDKLKNYDKIINICNRYKTPYIIYNKSKDNLKILLDIIYTNKYNHIQFNILIPNYNNQDYIIYSLKSIYLQTYSNYYIHILDDNSSDNSISKLTEFYKTINNVSNNYKIIVNKKNNGKYELINNYIKNSDIIKENNYLLVLDSDDILMPNRLLYDLYYIILENKKIIQSKYIRYNEEDKKIITEERYGETIITFNSGIINNIGLYMDKRYGCDSEYYDRIKIFVGENEIYKNDYISYIAFHKINRENLTIIYDKNKRIEFSKFYKNLHNIIYDNKIDIKKFIIEKKYNNIKYVNNLEYVFTFYLKNIHQVYISKSLINLADRFKNFYLLNDYTDINANLLIFGLFNKEDINVINKHKGIIYLLWAGTDIDDRFMYRKKYIEYIKNKNNIINLAMSESIKNRLENNNIECKKIYINFVDKSIFNNIKIESNNIDEQYIYIYNGSKESNNKEIYGNYIYDSIVKKLNNYKYIFSSELNIDYENMPKIYSRCFIGLRLTKEDGNANTTQEFIEMGIPIIHNGDEIKSIKWENEDDIIDKIIFYDKIRLIKMNKYMENKENLINLYDKRSLTEDNMVKIRDNLEIMIEHIKIYKNILIISSDYPSYGGCGTNSYDLYMEYKKYTNVKLIYFKYNKNEIINEDILKEYKDENIYFTEKENIIDVIKELKINFNLVILRNHLDINFKLIIKNVQVYYLIPGIFKDNLNVYYNQISNLELSKYINPNVIKTITYSDKIFCNSYHTIEILSSIINVKIFIYYFNFHKFISNNNNNENKIYDIIIVASNFKRKIKNMESIIKQIEEAKDKKIIIIGLNSELFINNDIKNNDNIKILSLIPNSQVINYIKESKYLLMNSFYESCSNLMLEAYFNNTIIINNISEM
jgi:hypothetical protein